METYVGWRQHATSNRTLNGIHRRVTTPFKQFFKGIWKKINWVSHSFLKYRLKWSRNICWRLEAHYRRTSFLSLFLTLGQCKCNGRNFYETLPVTRNSLYSLSATFNFTLFNISMFFIRLFCFRRLQKL